MSIALRQYNVSLEGIGQSFAIAVVGPYGANRINASFSDLPINTVLNRITSPLAADILDIGVAVQAADRLCLRGKPKKDRQFGYWSRQIHLDVPLRSPEHWLQKDVIGTLTELLSFRTDDEWSFSFNKRCDGGRPTEHSAQPLMWPSDPGESSAVTLFSGGIDSVYALHTLLKDNYDEVFPVTITNNRRVTCLRDNVIGTLDSNPENRATVRPVSTGIRMHSGGISLEDSARARAGYFIFAGTAFAINREVKVLNLAENGIGAMSLPMTTDHFGSRANKATHPKTLALAGELISLVCDDQFEMRNLGFHLTKGQMIQQLAGDPQAVSLLAKSATCDRKIFRGRTKGCGVCSSCLLRHAGFLSANFPDPIRYSVPPTLDHSRAHRDAIAIEYQANKLRRLLETQFDPIGALLMEFPQLRAVLDNLPSDEIPTAKRWDIVLSVLMRHIDEVAHLRLEKFGTQRAA